MTESHSSSHLVSVAIVGVGSHSKSASSSHLVSVAIVELSRGRSPKEVSGRGGGEGWW